ncbi:pilus assembly protein PilO [Cylindrospermum sp. FACHB-282]|uniref:pilus assembly protein PilO n=1 Tax=Cylindrospermum sp. FACHB-282 TaxID=2692794 RepID=UPI001684E5FF|nr:pilus assembly protein PilO [Cylindrospermum sp. FACHB-282]MBD2387754.1 pilus assembly protein PilO [Cylindrospermum sp. FACHB-282]
MTFSDDLSFAEHGGAFDEGTSPYPVVFGISFTPQIIGIIVGSLGLLGAGYMFLNLVMPTLESYQQQQVKNSELLVEIDQKKIKVQQADKIKEELAQAKQQKIQVLSLFANEKALSTLLLDTNRLVQSGAKTPGNGVGAQLKKFVPSANKPEIVTDGTLGLQVDNKLKRSNINVEIVGTFEQTQSIMRNIERLQPLMIVKDFQTKLEPPEAISPEDKNKRMRNGPVEITTSFQLQALMPLSPEDAAAIAADTAAKAKGQK